MPCALTMIAHSEDIDEWEAEVMAMPLRKRKNWSTLSFGVLGVKHRVRYHNGHFQMKLDDKLMADAKAFPIGGWAPVIRGGQGATEATYIQIADASGVEAAEACVSKGRPDMEHDPGPILSDEEMQTPAGFAKLQKGMLQEVAMRHTGHHHRNKRVSVPAAPGEPVRG